MCSLLDESGEPGDKVQLLADLEAPGEWRISALDKSRVDDSWHAGDAPDTDVQVGASDGDRRS